MPRFTRRSRFRRRRRRRGRRSFGRRRFKRRRMLMDPEKKLIDSDFGFPITQAGTFLLLNGVGQGVTQTTRIGRRALFASVHLNWCIGLNPTNQGPQCVRMSLLLDKQPNGGFPLAGQIYTQQTTILAPLGMRNLDEVNRFKVLWSKKVRLNLGQQVSMGTLFKQMRLSTVYATPGAAITDITNNSLLIYFSGDQTNVDDATAGANLVLNVRLRFVG